MASQQEVALTGWAIQTAWQQILRPSASRKTIFGCGRLVEGSWEVPETVVFRELKEQEIRQLRSHHPGRKLPCDCRDQNREAPGYLMIYALLVGPFS
jgi:hypothetical protein